MPHITPDEHSSLVGGSTASRRMGCPRSYALEQSLPPERSGSRFAQEGTALHEIMALVLRHEIEPTTLLPFIFTSEREGWTYTIDPDVWETKGEPALTAFDSFVLDEEKRIGADMRLMIETRVEFPDIPNAYGTSDIIARCGNEIFVMDWKFGSGIILAEDNAQMMFYACGALNTAKSFFDGMDVTDATPVTMVILQPLSQSGISIWRTDVARLNRFAADLRATVEIIRTKGMDAPVQEGSWCKFARCKSVCPIRINAAAQMARRFDRLKTLLEQRDQPVNDIPERYADLMDLVDIVEDWCGEVREQVHACIESGLDIPGWSLAPGRRGARKWAEDEAIIVQHLTVELGLPVDQVAPRALRTPTQLETLLRRSSTVLPEHLVVQPESTTRQLVKDRAAPVISATPAERATALARRLNGG